MAVLQIVSVGTPVRALQEALLVNGGSHGVAESSEAYRTGQRLIAEPLEVGV